jgi:signal peptidase II
MKLHEPLTNTIRPQRWGLFVWLLAFVVLCSVDLATRWWCFRQACSGQLLPGLGFAPFANYNFAFSLPVPEAIMYAIYAIAIVAILWHIVGRWHTFLSGSRAAWVMVLSGALANVAERMLLGYVRDFIQIGTGYVNVGDLYILGGAAYLLYRSFVRDGRNL